jgi:hypothetical protein
VYAGDDACVAEEQELGFKREGVKVDDFESAIYEEGLNLVNVDGKSAATGRPCDEDPITGTAGQVLEADEAPQLSCDVTIQALRMGDHEAACADSLR